jgi:hypothetical protein
MGPSPSTDAAGSIPAVNSRGAPLRQRPGRARRPVDLREFVAWMAVVYLAGMVLFLLALAGVIS